MDILHENTCFFIKRIHKYETILKSVPALPRDFLRKGSGGHGHASKPDTVYHFSPSAKSAKLLWPTFLSLP